MGHHGPFENGPRAAGATTLAEQARNPQPVQAIETPRIGETYPQLEWARASQADDTRRDVTRPKRHSGRGVFGQTGCVRRRPGRIDRRAKALGRARDSWQRQSALCIKIA